jgi:hypothetical protein
MAYHYENIHLEKGMYGRSGKTFSQTLEELDPSESYRGTADEGLDAFQRQLKRFDIRVKGAGSDMVEKFFHTTESAVLFPEFVSRVVRQGMEEESILPAITATVTRFDGMDYRSIASVPTEDEKALRRVEEGAKIPATAIRTQENLVRLHKRGRMLVASYEAIRFQRLDLFSVTLRQIGAYIGRMHLEDAIGVILDGDGNANPAQSLTVGTAPISGVKGTLSYDALLEFWSRFDPYAMNTMLVSSDVMLELLRLSEFQNPLTGLNFQGTGKLITPPGRHAAAHLRLPGGHPHRAGQELRPGDDQRLRRHGGVRQAHRPAAGAGRHHLHLRFCQALHRGIQGPDDLTPLVRGRWKIPRLTARGNAAPRGRGRIRFAPRGGTGANPPFSSKQIALRSKPLTAIFRAAPFVFPLPTAPASLGCGGSPVSYGKKMRR